MNSTNQPVSSLLHMGAWDNNIYPETGLDVKYPLILPRMSQSLISNGDSGSADDFQRISRWIAITQSIVQGVVTCQRLATALVA